MSPQNQQYLMYGGAGLAVLALLVAAVCKPRFKVPTILGGTVGGLIAGTGIGMAVMVAIGYRTVETTGQEQGGPPPGMGRPGAGGMPGGGGMVGGMGGGMGGMPQSKNQLVALLAKLDLLTSKPLQVSLNSEQQTQVREQLQGLDTEEKLTDEEAKKRLDALLKVLTPDKASLEAVGYRWPGQQGGRGGARPQPQGQVPNPFKEGENNEHLKALQQRMKGGK